MYGCDKQLGHREWEREAEETVNCFLCWSVMSLKMMALLSANKPNNQIRAVVLRPSGGYLSCCRADSRVGDWPLIVRCRPFSAFRPAPSRTVLSHMMDMNSLRVFFRDRTEIGGRGEEGGSMQNLVIRRCNSVRDCQPQEVTHWSRAGWRREVIIELKPEFHHHTQNLTSTSFKLN